MFGLETISFNTNSSLGKDLEKLFQDVMDYRDSLPMGTYEFRSDNISKVVAYFKDRVPDLIKLVEKNTGFTLKHVFVYGGVDTACSGFFAMETDPELECEDQLAAAYGRMSGSSYFNTMDYEEKLRQLDALSNNLDTATGIYKEKVKYKSRLTLKLHFDANLAFLRKEFLPGETDYTAAEITAIILHELGHATTIVEHLGDHYYRHLGGRDLIRSALMDTKATKKQYLKAIEIIDTKITTLSRETKTSDKSMLYTAYNTLKSCLLDAISESDAPDGEPWITTMVDTVRVIIGMFILVVLAILCFNWAWILGYYVEIRSKFFKTSKNSDEKISDVTNNKSNIYQIERWADEFATRHGYGAELGSALNKLHYDSETYMFVSFGRVKSQIIRDSGLFHVIFRLAGMISRHTFIITMMDPILYENQQNRNKRIRENILSVFKNEDMPPEVTDYWLEQLILSEKNFNEAKRWYHSGFFKALKNLFINIDNPVRWLSLLNNGNMYRDFEILADNVDAMQDNALYAIAAQMRR